MKVSFLTSGFPNGFTEDFIKCIKDYYYNKGVIIFIASDFGQHSKTDKYIDIFLNMFESKGILFRESYVIDDRVTSKEAIHYIEKSDIVWILGGDTLKQIRNIKEYNLIPVLQNRKGITIGMSAGSINMAKKVVISKDVNDNIPELSIYSGIGLVDINVEPHLDSASEDHMKEIYEASHHSIIYGIYDNSFIKIVDECIEVYGTCFKYEDVTY